MKLKPCFSKTKTRYHTITKHFCDGEKDCSAGQTSKLATNAAQQIDKPATLWCMSSTIDHRQSQQQPQNTSTLKWIKGISQLDAGGYTPVRKHTCNTQQISFVCAEKLRKQFTSEAPTQLDFASSEWWIYPPWSSRPDGVEEGGILSFWHRVLVTERGSTNCCQEGHPDWVNQKMIIGPVPDPNGDTQISWRLRSVFTCSFEPRNLWPNGTRSGFPLDTVRTYWRRNSKFGCTAIVHSCL